LDYQEAVGYLNSFINFERLPEPHFNTKVRDIERFRALLGDLGNPQNNYPIIHIAGTKGKGSTAAIVSSILRAAGYKVGLYTSPHLVTVRERLRIDGRIISKRDFASLINQIANVPLISQSNNNVAYRTVFEHLTAAALLWFARRNVDVAVIEAGLGGKLDATVVVNPVLSIITPIGLDHTDVLGDTISAIAADKAYIIKKDVPAVSAQQVADAKEELVERTEKVSTQLTFAPGQSEFKLLASSFKGQNIRSSRAWLGQGDIYFNLTGRFQLDNVSTALIAIEQLNKMRFNISPEAVRTGLKKIRWQGRMQYISGQPAIILDGSHNLLSMKVLLESLLDPLLCQVLTPDTTTNLKYRVIFSAMRSKPVEGMLHLLGEIAEQVYVAPLTFPKGMSQDELFTSADSASVSVISCRDVPTAFEMARRDTGEGEILLATGSLYLVGEIMRYLKGIPAPPVDGRIDDFV